MNSPYMRNLAYHELTENRAVIAKIYALLDSKIGRSVLMSYDRAIFHATKYVPIELDD